MLKPSPALISPGGAIHYWWAYTSGVTPLITSNPKVHAKNKREVHSRPASNVRGISYCCRRRPTSCPENSRHLRHRRNAHVSGHPSKPPKDGSSDTYWHSLPKHQQPTPYDVLSHPREGPYSKRRFNYLVKLYHPDLCPSKAASEALSLEHPSVHPSELPMSTRIQRYHLLVQAHTLLSDPMKRAAYDRHGAGWASTPSLAELRKENSPRGWAAAREHRQNTPWNCATWEDWEAWWACEAERRRREDADIFAHDFTRPFNKDSPTSAHDAAEKAAWWVSWVHARRAADSNFTSWHPNSNPSSRSSSYPAQKPIYTSNGLFVILLGACTLTGAIYEWNRAGRSSKSYLAQLERQNLENWADLNRRKDGGSAAGAGLPESREQRLGRFLRDRSEDVTFAGRIAELDSTSDGGGNGNGVQTQDGRQVRGEKEILDQKTAVGQKGG